MNYVLIVDDHADIRRLLSVTLGRKFDIIEAETGEAALSAVRKYNPTVVLLDVMLPGEVDGLRVLDTIKGKAETKAIKVAMVSARGQDADVLQAKARGADAYFVKPFSPLQVVEWIQAQFK
jgi:DNA-binding response OmpR family regulator